MTFTKLGEMEEFIERQINFHEHKEENCFCSSLREKLGKTKLQLADIEFDNQEEKELEGEELSFNERGGYPDYADINPDN